MGEGLLRQRRNLVIISGILIVFDFTSITIDKVNLLGIHFLVGKPENLIIIAWVLWAYFLLRYYQYLRDEPDLKIIYLLKSYFYE